MEPHCIALLLRRLSQFLDAFITNHETNIITRKVIAAFVYGIVIPGIPCVPAQKINKFGGSTMKEMGPGKVRVPDTAVVSYLGCAFSGNEDEVKDGKKFYYLYV